MARLWDGIWKSQVELDQLPTDTPAWNTMLKAANEPVGDPSIKEQESMTNVNYLAKALVYAKTGNEAYLTPCLKAIRIIATGTIEAGARALALGRELPAYVIIADLIKLKDKDPGLHELFKTKLHYLLHTFKTINGPASLAQSSEKRPNNWGAHALAARIAIDMYMEDYEDLGFTATIFQGYLGDRNAYAGFTFGDDLSWQADPKVPVSINPPGSKLKDKDGVMRDVDGAQPEELRRKGSFTWPVPTDNTYPWEALQGLTVAAVMLERAGYLAFDWSDAALKRAVEWLYRNNWPATGDDRWNIYLINYAYNLGLPADPEATPGKNMGWTAWTHDEPGAEPTTVNLIVNLTPGGIVSSNPSGTEFDPGTVVTLQAVPDPGFQFVGWSGSVQSVDNPLMLTMNTDKTLMAMFQEVAPDDELVKLKAKVAAAQESLLAMQISIILISKTASNLVTTLDELNTEVQTIFDELS